MGTIRCGTICFGTIGVSTPSKRPVSVSKFSGGSALLQYIPLSARNPLNYSMLGIQTRTIYRGTGTQLHSTFNVANYMNVGTVLNIGSSYYEDCLMRFSAPPGYLLHIAPSEPMVRKLAKQFILFIFTA